MKPISLTQRNGDFGTRLRSFPTRGGDASLSGLGGPLGIGASEINGDTGRSPADRLGHRIFLQLFSLCSRLPRCPARSRSNAPFSNHRASACRKDSPASSACWAARRTRGRPAGGNSPSIFLHASAPLGCQKKCRRTRPPSRPRWTAQPARPSRPCGKGRTSRSQSSFANRLHMSAHAVDDP